MESRTITETPPAHQAAEPPRDSGAAQSWWRDLLSSPLVIWSVICLALAALSAAILPTVPSYDPWSWIVWGRELVNPHLGFSTGGGPSWKPLPVIFTTVYGLFGGASPTLWVITARAGGLMSLVAAYRLASRMTPGETWMRAVAGVLAAIGIVLTQEWAYYMYRGTSEPMLVGLSLWAVDRHLGGQARRGVPAGCRRGADPSRGLAVHRDLRRMAVCARAAAAPAGAARLAVDPGAVVRATVDQLR